jgi:hypothetical protein
MRMADPQASSPLQPPQTPSDSFSDRFMRNVAQAVRQMFAANEPANFTTVRRAELEEVNESRGLRGRDPINDDLTGLACSGGGIRSATFNLGIIQGLAHYGWLRQIDYTSTISGGGYIGSWLVAWIRRVGSAAVEDRLKDNRQPPPSTEPDRYLEPDQVRFLRKYSNYLAPWTGLLGADTWTIVAVYLRNLILNLLVLIAFGSCLLLLPDLGLWLFQSGLVPPASVLVAITAISLVFLMAVIGMGFGALSSQSPARRDWRRIIVARAGILTSSATLLAALCGMLLLGYWRVGVGTVALNRWILWSGALFVALWLVAVICWAWSRGGQDPVPIESRAFRWTMLALTALLIGALFGWMLYEMGRLFEWLNPQGASPTWLYAGRVALLVLGPPLLVITTMIAAAFQMGLSGRSMPDAQREWLARAGAVTFLLALFWIVGTGAAFYGPLLVKFLVGSGWATEQWGRFVKWLLGLGWLSTTAAGLLAGRSASTNGARNGKFSVITRVAPPVFAAGLVLLLSFGLDAALGYLAAAPETNVSVTEHEQHTAERSSAQVKASVHELLNASGLKAQAQAVAQLDKSQTPHGASFHDLALRHWSRLGTYARSDPKASLWDQVSGSCLWQVLSVALLVLFIFSNRVDINEFSLHLFYRNRLTRAYLGASVTGREPDPFTGFSADDDIPLHALSTRYPPQPRMPVDRLQPIVNNKAKYDGPYPIFGTALNLVRGKELAWQNRKAASFVFTPLYCGYDYYADASQPVKRNYKRAAYRPTREYTREGGPRLGTAVAISGAAASPNMGYHTSSALGFLMTVFNVRLGAWFANPRHATLWRRRSAPASGLLYLLRELFPRTSDDMHFVYLSDGGHFENLGLYELVRRRCTYIICGDGSCDENMSFDDLGRALDKCRRDFGVEIDIKLDKLLLNEKQSSAAHFAIGTISYPDQKQTGFLLYIKPCRVGDEPSDVFSYCKQNRKFPHDTTADQFFSESQFESYRALGYHSFRVLATVASTIRTSDKQLQAPASLQDLLKRLAELRDAPPSLWKDIGQLIGHHMSAGKS